MVRLMATLAALTLGGCSAMASGGCFTQREVLLPNRELVLANVTKGQVGKDIAAAVLDGRTDDVTAMVKRDPALLSVEVTYDKTKSSERPEGQYGDLLSFAISRCDLAMEQHLLDLGASVNGVQVGQALTLGLLSDIPEMAELLLQRGASPDPQKSGGTNALERATAFSQVGGVMMLLRHGADVNWQDEFGNGYLHTATAGQQYSIAEVLISKGAHLWRINGAGGMPVQRLFNPLILENPTEDKARLRLLAAAEADAKAKGLPWPPPDFKTVRKMVLRGLWPTPAMLAAGVPPVSDIALADMQSFRNEIEE
jgi:hypothetical protein